jgi:hypothetical protein
MFVIWRGYGLLIVLAAAVGVAVAVAISFAFQSAGIKVPDGILIAMMGVCVTAVCYGTTLLLERSDKGRAVIDKNTGEEFLLRRRDSLFFIPVRWWTYAAGALTIFWFILAIVGGSGKT